MKEWQVPGAAVAVVSGEGVLLAKGYGTREPDAPRPVSEQTLFALASTTKAFSAASLAMLVDQGKLRWDDLVVKHLPWFRVKDPQVSMEMTIRDLLSHRTGVRDSGSLEAAYPEPELFVRMRHLEQRAPFRSEHVYNNLLYRLPAAIVAAVTGQPWESFVRERIFAPLNMRNSQTSARDLASMPDVARMCQVVDGRPRSFPTRPFERESSSAGSLYSNAIEMAAWLRLHLGHGVYNGVRLVSQAAMSEMHTPVVFDRLARDAWAGVYSQTLFNAYALGWHVRDHRGHLVIEHGGRNNGMSAHVGFLPREQLGVAVLSNLGTSSPGFPDAVAYRLYDLYLRQPEVDWSRRALEARTATQVAPKDEPPRTSGTRPSLTPDSYAGSYEDDMYGLVRVEVAGGELMLHWFGRPGVLAKLEHWHFDTFRLLWNDNGFRLPRFATFSLDERGRVATLTVAGFPARFSRATGEG